MRQKTRKWTPAFWERCWPVVAEVVEEAEVRSSTNGGDDEGETDERDHW